MATRTKIWKIVSAVFAAIFLFFVLIAYFRYVALKREFISRLTEKASAAVGQKVRIGDISFGPSTKINISDIVVENPEDFPKGELLRLKRASLDLNFPELAKGRVYLRRVEITGPELSLARDRNGRLNISDKLRDFLSKKGTTEYLIDELRISSGRFDLDKDLRFHIGDIKVILRSLSSDSGAKTSVEMSALCPGEGRLSLEGSAYLNADPKRIDISAALKNVKLSLFEDLAGKKVAGDERRQRLDINLAAKSDIRGGLALKAGAKMKDARLQFVRKNLKYVSLNVDASVDLKNDSISINDATLEADGATARLAASVKGLKGVPYYDAKVGLTLSDLSVFSVGETFAAGGVLTSDVGIRGKLGKGLPAMSGVFQLTNASVTYSGIHTQCGSARLTFNKPEGSLDSVKGSASLRARNISFAKTEGNKAVAKNVNLDADLAFRGRILDLKTKVEAGKITTFLSGTVEDFLGRARTAKIRAVLPDTGLADIRGALWDVFPDKMLYASLNGSVVADFSVVYGTDVMTVGGQLRVKDVSLDGENSEYSIGPMNGTIPVVYAKSSPVETPPSLPSFERAEFSKLSDYYKQKRPEEGSHKFTIGTLRYGFRLLNDLTVWMDRQGSYLNISRYDANIFGGKLSGSAVVDVSDGFGYRVGMIARGISLTQLCEDIIPIKGYLSGKVDGLALLKGSGADLNGLIGRADFWSYAEGREKTKISKEFLQKMGGPQMKSYIGERPFDKGTVSLYLQNGFLIFKELEISHTTFLGMKDLSVKVAPFNNRISLDHLMSTIAEAAERAKKE